jgi:hypothetical protein
MSLCHASSAGALIVVVISLSHPHHPCLTIIFLESHRVNKDIILSAVAKDPTLQRSEVECPECHHNEAVLIQSTQNTKSKRLTLIMVRVLGWSA